jgi:RNA polymerase sigma factor (sigma-70 family)
MIDAIEIEALSRRYGRMVLRRCQQLLHDEDQALDACQDVFVRLLERGDRVDVRYPSSLLYRVATNVCLNRIRDRGRHTSCSDDDVVMQIADAEEPGARSDARLLLDRLFGRQQESTRTMAVLHYVDGLTLEQVAAETGLSVSGVRKRLRALRASLVDLVERVP